MRPAELENKTLVIIDRVRQNAPVEGSNIELKSEWPEPRKSARRLAGHCNASGGDPVLWLIGLDEQKGVVGAKFEELADWWAAVLAEFDQEAPTLMVSLPVHTEDSTVVALLFDPSRAPFVVWNPNRGRPEAGPVQREVPWREGNATRTARRSDMLRILVPAVRVPELELLRAEATMVQDNAGRWLLTTDLEIYCVARSPVTFVAHRSLVRIEPQHLNVLNGRSHDLRFGDPDEGMIARRRDIVLNRSAAFDFRVHGYTDAMGPCLPHEFTIEVEFGIIDLIAKPAVRANLRQVNCESGQLWYSTPPFPRPTLA